MTEKICADCCYYLNAFAIPCKGSCDHPAQRGKHKKVWWNTLACKDFAVVLPKTKKLNQ